MRRRFRRYNRLFLSGAISLFLAVALLNLFVDPFSIYPSFALESLTPYRKIGPSRITSAESLVRTNPDVLLLGTSRTKNGLEVDHWAFGGRVAFNAGLPAGSMEELLQVARLALAQTDVSEIVFFADFFSFNSKRIPIAGFRSSRFSPTFNALDFHLEQTLSLTALSRSKAVISRWRSEKVAMRVKVINRQVIARDMAAFHNDPLLYHEFGEGNEPWQQFTDLVEESKKQGVALKVVLLPVHATMLETLRHAGLWQGWEHWKRTLVDIAGPEIPIWDFQYYGEISSRPVADSEDMVEAMKWFKDPSHALPILCSQVLDRVYGLHDHLDGPMKFGHQLKAETMSAWLEDIRSMRSHYAQQQPKDIQWVNEILKSRK